jgi:heat shock protein HslJ
MMNHVTMVLALGASLMAAGAARAAEPPPFTDTRWALTEFGGENFAPGSRTNTHVIFRSNGKLSGYAFCNTMFSSYASEDGKLTIKPIGTTMRACVDPADNAREQAFLKALRDARSWRIDGGRLTLLDEAGTELARFAAAPQ